ncbi:MAG: hypothetical protein O4859_27045 [Trichodesmium sp. St18_bin1]|nr:hypothetical protein [Trichodesmium sp. St18_bin1]
MNSALVIGSFLETSIKMTEVEPEKKIEEGFVGIDRGFVAAPLGSV